MTRSVMGALIQEMTGTGDSAEGRKKRALKKRKENLKSDLRDYIKYEGELKKRGVSKKDAMLKMKFHDRYISPKKIEARRNEAKKMIQDGVVDKKYFKGLLSSSKKSKESLKIEKED